MAFLRRRLGPDCCRASAEGQTNNWEDHIIEDVIAYVDANFRTLARELAQILMVNDVPFDYMQTRGSHNSEYWRRSIGHMMTIQHEVMRHALGNRP